MGNAGLELVKKSEAFRAFPYPDPASKLARATPGKRWGFVAPRSILATLDEKTQALSGAPWTIGYGETEGVDLDDTTTKAQAEVHVAMRYKQFENEVRAVCKVVPNVNQLAAMTSLAYNIGVSAFTNKCSVLKRHNEGKFDEAGRSFALWNKAGGKEERGLTIRRAAEAALYLTIVPGTMTALVAEEPISQQLTPESNGWTSPINIGTGVASTVGTASVTVQAVKEVKSTAAELGDWLPWVLAGAAILIAGYVVIRSRFNQRSKGWA